VKIAGDVFIRLIRLLIAPLIFLTLVAGVQAPGDPARLGATGAKAIALSPGATGLAAIIGLGMGALFQPGRGAPSPGNGAARRSNGMKQPA